MGTTTLMSFAEFELLDAGADDVELLRGELIRVPPPQRKHMEICEATLQTVGCRIRSDGSTQAQGAEIGELEMEMGYQNLE